MAGRPVLPRVSNRFTGLRTNYEQTAMQELKRKRFHMISATAIIVAALVIIYLLGSVLLTVLFSGLIAYVLLPLAQSLVKLMPWRESRPELSRTIAVAIIFVVAAGIAAGLLAIAIPPTVRQSQEFIDEFPTFFASARVTVEGWIGEYSERVPQEVKSRIEDYLARMGSVLGESAFQILPKTVGFIVGSISVIIGLATMPLLIFYFTKDSRQIGSYLMLPFPQVLRPYFSDMARIADRTLGGYLRGQLALGIIVGVAVTIGLVAMGIPFAAVLGVVAGASELVPILGPWIGAAAGLLVTLAIAPEKILWVGLLYLGVQLVENVLLVPRVQAETLKIHPVAVVIAIIVGSHFFGFWGIILGPPLLSLSKDIVKYLTHEWDEPPSEANATPETVESDQNESDESGCD